MTPGKRTSPLWNYFTALDDYMAKCNVCNVTLTHRTSTSNLKKHFRRKHPHLDINDESQAFEFQTDENENDGEEGELQEFILINPSPSSSNPNDGSIQEPVDSKVLVKKRKMEYPTVKPKFTKLEDEEMKGLISIGETLSRIVSTPDDDDEIFGKFLTVELKKFTNKKMKSSCKRDMLSVLMEYGTAEDNDTD